MISEKYKNDMGYLSTEFWEKEIDTILEYEILIVHDFSLFLQKWDVQEANYLNVGDRHEDSYSTVWC